MQLTRITRFWFTGLRPELSCSVVRVHSWHACMTTARLDPQQVHNLTSACVSVPLLSFYQGLRLGMCLDGAACPRRWLAAGPVQGLAAVVLHHQVCLLRFNDFMVLLSTVPCMHTVMLLCASW